MSRTFSAVARLPEGPKRTAAIAAWIQDLYVSNPPILVGGGAVELYTAGAYTTGDFDFVGSVPPEVKAAFEKAGFKKEGRHWIQADEELFVEFPGSAIQKHEKTALLETEGIQVLTLSPEDVIVDRLAAWQFWTSTTDGASAFLVLRAQERALDNERLERLAQRRGVEKALASLIDFARRRHSRAPSPEELEEWATKHP